MSGSCPKCFKRFPDEPQTRCPRCGFVISQVPDTALELRLRQTGERVRIEAASGGIVGRENLGGEFLERIPQVSRAHCRLRWQEGRWVVEDLDSSRGTFVGTEGRKLKRGELVPLAHGDRLLLGREAFDVTLVPLAPPAGAVAPAPVVVERVTQASACLGCGTIMDAAVSVCPSCYRARD